MGGAEQPGPVARALAAVEYLARMHPTAAVTAADREGVPVDVPPELGFAPPPPADPGAPVGIQAVHPDDRLQVVRAWQRARRNGVALVAARILDGTPIQVHFADLRETHGVFLTIAVPDDGTAPPEGHDSEPLPPRVCLVRRDGVGTILEVDGAAVEMFGWTAREIVGQRSIDFIHPDDHDRAIDNWVEVLATPGGSQRYRVRHLRRDRTYMWLDVTNHNRLEDPEHGDVLSEMVDITEEMAAHEALAEREQLLRELTDALPVGVVQFGPDRATVHENEQLASIVGAPGLDGLLASVAPADRAALRAGLDTVAAGRVPEPFEVHVPSTGRVCRVTLRPLQDGGGLACVDDVTEAARMRKELQVQATFDSLTACFNRQTILGALDHVAGKEPGTGVVFVDLDRFKPVNDELGHAAGDELLAIVADRLRAAVRDVDLVGRLGGDEFLVVCPGVADRAAVEAIATRIADRLSAPFHLRDVHLVRPRASIGVAWAPAGTEPAALVAQADAAMYESKRQGRRLQGDDEGGEGTGMAGGKGRDRDATPAS